MKRAPLGQSSIELVAGLLVMTPIVLFGVDAATLFMGHQMNDSVCRDAARAAAQGPPSYIVPNGPVNRAKMVVQKAAAGCTGAIRIQAHGTVSEKVSPPQPQAPFGGPVLGSVTVSTTADIYPPFLMSVLGMKVVTAKSSHTFPITYVLPSGFSTGAGGGPANLATGGSPGTGGGAGPGGNPIGGGIGSNPLPPGGGGTGSGSGSSPTGGYNSTGNF